jgi:hypothetical protein
MEKQTRTVIGRLKQVTENIKAVEAKNSSPQKL